MSPPGTVAQPHPPHGSLARERRKNRVPGAERKRRQGSRRLVIVQCDKCGAKATGRAAGGQLVASDLRTTYGRNLGLRHRDCGGQMLAYDIKESA